MSTEIEDALREEIRNLREWIAFMRLNIRDERLQRMCDAALSGKKLEVVR